MGQARNYNSVKPLTLCTAIPVGTITKGDKPNSRRFVSNIRIDIRPTDRFFSRSDRTVGPNVYYEGQKVDYLYPKIEYSIDIVDDSYLSVGSELLLKRII